MIVKLLTEHHLEILSLKVGCRGSSESTFAKISNCWKSHATAHLSVCISYANKNLLDTNKNSICTKAIYIILLTAKTQSDRDSLFHFL